MTPLLNHDAGLSLPLTELAAYADEVWEQLSPPVNAAYEKLMENEEFWEYPTHSHFFRAAGWAQLAHA